MTRWFRFYDDALNDPKVQKLSGDNYKAWVNLLCLASKNNGVLPQIEDMAFALRMANEQIKSLLDGFVRIELVDVSDGVYQPHNWSTRQYKSDSSTDRVKQYREREGNVSKTVNETAPEQIQNRTDSEQTSRPRDSWSEFRIEAYQASEKFNSLAVHNSIGLMDRWKAAGLPLDMCRAVLFAGIQAQPDKGMKYWEAVIRGELEKKTPVPAKAKPQQETEADWREVLDRLIAEGRKWPCRYPKYIPEPFAREHFLAAQKPPFLDRRAQA